MTHVTRYRWRLLDTGPFWMDGGGMFGPMPRTLWSRWVKPDDLGRIPLAQNCLLLQGKQNILIEAGSGSKFDAKWRNIYGLGDRNVLDALREADCAPDSIAHAILTHLHFDHVGGLTRWGAGGNSEPVFPDATIHAQKREWDDALINRSVMTRTYLPENLHPLRERMRLLESPPPFERGYIPRRDEFPAASAIDRLTEILPGIYSLLVPGHTWGQQAILFRDDRGRTVVFTPDVLPTAFHVGAACNLAYDVEPYISTITRRWFLQAAVENDWLLVLNHEPHHPLQRVRSDGKGWFTLAPEAA